MWESRLSGSERAIGKGEMSCTSNQSLWLLDRVSVSSQNPGRCPRLVCAAPLGHDCIQCIHTDSKALPRVCNAPLGLRGGSAPEGLAASPLTVPA